MDMLKKYEKTMEELAKKEVEFLETKKEYDFKKFEIITTFNFKQEYGKDNETIRNGHIKKVLEELIDKKNALELEIQWIKRDLRFQELEIEYGG